MAHSQDDNLNAKYREFCTAVGHLFISFGRLEGTLSAILRLHLANNFADHLGQREAVRMSSAIYGSLRFKAARDTLRRLSKAEGVSDDVEKFLDAVFTQVGHIEVLRDKLAHHVVVASADEEAEGYWQVSDQAVTRDLSKIKVYVFDDDAVVAAAFDLIAVGHRLGGYKQGTNLFTKDALSLEPIAWQYKPSMLKQVRRGTARTLQGRPTPPQS